MRLRAAQRCLAGRQLRTAGSSASLSGRPYAQLALDLFAPAVDGFRGEALIEPALVPGEEAALHAVLVSVGIPVLTGIPHRPPLLPAEHQDLHDGAALMANFQAADEGRCQQDNRLALLCSQTGDGVRRVLRRKGERLVESARG